MILIATNRRSRGGIARSMVGELGQPCDTRQLLYGGPMKSPAYLAIDPMAKVHVIRHDGCAVNEGAAIRDKEAMQ